MTESGTLSNLGGVTISSHMKLNWTFLLPFFFVASQRSSTYLSAWNRVFQLATLFTWRRCLEFGGATAFILLQCLVFYLFSHALFELCQMLKERRPKWNSAACIQPDSIQFALRSGRIT